MRFFKLAKSTLKTCHPALRSLSSSSQFENRMRYWGAWEEKGKSATFRSGTARGTCMDAPSPGSWDDDVAFGNIHTAAHQQGIGGVIQLGTVDFSAQTAEEVGAKHGTAAHGFGAR